MMKPQKLDGFMLLKNNKNNKKVMNKIALSLLFALGFFTNGWTQQDPHYTQYMYNMSVFNPAYAGSKEDLSMGILYRKQWVNIEDAPTTISVFGNQPVGKNLGAGLSIVSDKLGPISEKNIYADLSYTLQLNESMKIAVGMKTGATFHSVDLFSQIASTLPDPNEGIFGRDINKTSLNFGTGVFFYTDHYYFGISIPNILKTPHFDYNGESYGSEVSHYFITGGYVFDLNSDWKFKPFAMVKSSFGAPVSYDVSTNFLYNNQVEFGLTYRKQDSFGGMVNINITPQLRIGYAYDSIISNLNYTTNASHEIILLFDLINYKKVSRSPRFF